MVSSTIDMQLDELLATLARIKTQHADDPAYREWRTRFPKSWPM
jgi:hypothetical protein